MNVAVAEQQMEFLPPSPESIISALECPKRLREICRRQTQGGSVAARKKRKNLWLFEQARPPIRARLLRVSQPRRYREGQKPVSLGRKPLNQRERDADRLLQWEMRTLGVYDHRPKMWGDCMPLRCPHCSADVVMKVVEQDGDYEDAFECPDCGKAVRFRASPDGAGRWVRCSSKTPTPPLTGESYADYAQALNHAGPCPWFSCKHHLYKDEDPETGLTKLVFPIIDENGRLVDFADLAKESCSLRAADKVEWPKERMTLEEIGKKVNLTQERVNQVLRSGLRKFVESDVAWDVAEDEGPKAILRMLTGRGD